MCVCESKLNRSERVTIVFTFIYDKVCVCPNACYLLFGRERERKNAVSTSKRIKIIILFSKMTRVICTYDSNHFLFHSPHGIDACFFRFQLWLWHCQPKRIYNQPLIFILAWWCSSLSNDRLQNIPTIFPNTKPNWVPRKHQPERFYLCQCYLCYTLHTIRKMK